MITKNAKYFAKMKLFVSDNGLAFLCFISLLLPLSLKFGQNDDFSYFIYDDHFNIFEHPQYKFFSIVGRPLYNFFIFIIGNFTYSLETFFIVRILSLLALFYNYYLISNFLQRYYDRFFSSIIAVSICFLPGYISGLIWLTMAPFYISSALSIVSAVLLIDNFEREYSKKIYYWRKNFFCFGLIFISMYIYQPWALCGLLIIFIYCINVFNLRKFFYLTLLFFFPIICNVLFHRYIYLPINFYFNPNDINFNNSLGDWKFAINSDPISRIFQFISNYLFILFDIWNISEIKYLRYIFISFILFMLFLCKSYLNLRLLLNISIFLCFVLLSLSPFFMTISGHAGYRLLLPAMMLFAFCFINISNIFLTKIFSEKRLRKNLLILILFIYVMPVYTNFFLSCLSHFYEVKFIEDKIATNQNISCINFIQSRKLETSFLGHTTRGNGEFNYSNTSQISNIPFILRAIYIDLGIPREDLKVDVTNKGTFIGNKKLFINQNLENCLNIDMNYF